MGLSPVPFPWRDDDDVRTAAVDAAARHHGHEEVAGQAVDTVALTLLSPSRQYLEALCGTNPTLDDWSRSISARNHRTIRVPWAQSG